MTRYIHEIPAQRDKPADVHVLFTTDAAAACPVDGEPMTASDLPTVDERREAAADAKARARGARPASRRPGR